jgi:adenosine deaminase
MPKAELHVHLEGTIAPETLWAMAARNQVSLPVGTLEELRTLYTFESFDKFLQLWLVMCGCLRRAEDYEQLVDAFVEGCHAQNIRYAEVHFTPYNHERFGFGGRRALEIVARRLEAAEGRGPVVRLITDIPSECVAESGPYTAALPESSPIPWWWPSAPVGPRKASRDGWVAPYFERARRAGYPAVAHAGETAGADHVRQAVLEPARRVQHGVRAVEDEATVRLLPSATSRRDVALTSNRFLTVYRDSPPSPAAPPRRWRPVTLSTDDPRSSAPTSPASAQRLAHEALGLTLRRAVADQPERAALRPGRDRPPPPPDAGVRVGRRRTGPLKKA